MEIKVLGSGCRTCQLLHDNVIEALREMQIEANVEYVQDIRKILDYNIMATPGLVIDEEVKSSGSSLTKSQIKRLIAAALED